ncbi:MAG TPA: acyl-CoA dehydrogenase [Burkholderiaceae bacterium]|nr:acyl-CoA dehydrogenase [Burkholderiaceae bacterium]
MPYQAPVKDMLFVMNELADLAAVNALPGNEDATPDTAEAVLEENAKFCSNVVAPLNNPADKEPSYWHDGQVTTSKGFKEAFKAFAEAGWQGVQHPVEFGGQGLPKLLATPCIEMLNSSNVSFALCPLLTDGAIEALLTAGSDEQKATYLENLVSGKWTGTMNLTEPQAGSDLAAVRSRAVPQGDGTYKIFGTKIFITYGEHDMAENIIHLVLARTPDAPAGVKGISLFIVPKFLVNADGTLGARNDAHCVSIEHKLGIKASPTAVLQFGDNGGAIGTLVGEENRGLEYMFIMMNAARFGVGLQGIGVAERSYQRAVAFAKDRVQSRDLAGSAGPVSIIHHPDVRRMLMSMRSQIEAARALAYVGAGLSDIAHNHPDAAVRAANLATYEFLVPLIKGWSTEMAQDVTRDGVQVHGGMGFIEETGAAQHYRDVKILTIYEGTTAIQANDLIGRKIAREQGATIKAVIADMRAALAKLDGDLAVVGRRQKAGIDALEQAADWIVANFGKDVKAALAAAVPFLHLFGIVAGGWQMGRAAVIARDRIAAGDADPFWAAKLNTVRFYADHLLTQAEGLAETVIHGAAGALEMDDDSF